MAAFAAAIALGFGGLLFTAVSPASADTQSDGGSGGVGISVNIPGSSDTASPPPSDGSGGGSGDGGSGDAGSGGTGGSGSGGGSTGTGGGAGGNGPLNLSGLHAVFIPSFNPFAGSVLVSFTVHNGSKSAISSKAQFWLTGPVGNVLSDTGRFPLPALKPGQTMLVERVLGNVGQWSVVTAHAKYFPPGSVDGIALKAAVRDVTIFAFPWLGTTSIVALLGSFLIIRASGFGIFALRAV